MFLSDDFLNRGRIEQRTKKKKKNKGVLRGSGLAEKERTNKGANCPRFKIKFSQVNLRKWCADYLHRLDVLCEWVADEWE